MIILYIIERKHFYRYCLQTSSTEEISKSHVKDWFKINGKQGLQCLKNASMINSKIMAEK